MLYTRVMLGGRRTVDDGGVHFVVWWTILTGLTVLFFHVFQTLQCRLPGPC